MGTHRSGGSTICYEVGSGNVYRDLGFSDADEMLVKARLVSTLSNIIFERGYRLSEVSARLECPTSRLRRLLRGQFRRASVRGLEAAVARLKVDSGVRAEEQLVGQCGASCTSTWKTLACSSPGAPQGLGDRFEAMPGRLPSSAE